MTDSLADSVIARVRMQRDLVQAMHEHCKSLSVSVTSRDKSVKVEVDGLGTMTGLWLAEFAHRNGADALSKLIVDTAHAAANVALERQKYLIKEFTERLATLQHLPLSRRDGSIFQSGLPADERLLDRGFDRRAQRRGQIDDVNGAHRQ
jgi:DNA-binding protein YbaB